MLSRCIIQTSIGWLCRSSRKTCSFVTDHGLRGSNSGTPPASPSALSIQVQESPNTDSRLSSFRYGSPNDWSQARSCEHSLRPILLKPSSNHNSSRMWLWQPKRQYQSFLFLQFAEQIDDWSEPSSASLHYEFIWPRAISFIIKVERLCCNIHIKTKRNKPDNCEKDSDTRDRSGREVWYTSTIR